MAEITPPLSTAQVLTSFYSEARSLRHPTVRPRVATVREHLEVYLDTEAEQWLLPDEQALVDAERQMDPAGAVARVTGPEALVAVLPGFLDEAWLLPLPSDARAQLRLVTELVDWLLQTGTVDGGAMACSILEIDTVVRRARKRLAGRNDGGPLRTR
ncbi:hypothetical protein PU560_14045 [Georgenia sp. 10Sc9-8]|uniref:Uncharacterized protein n=1 Tax=Georgenia halotolerans TaxID=3028317 RepID=A0ABT5TZS6_9MICO|nr:hypothetical protein [Georgenia halotolerans]